MTQVTIDLTNPETRKKFRVTHSFNFMKFRCFEHMYNHPEPITSIEIAEALRLPMQAVSKVLSRSYTQGHGYVRRLKKASGSRFYRYILTKKGRKAYALYLKRIKQGLSLNLHKTNPPRMTNYTGISPKDLNLKMREARELTVDEFTAYLKVTRRDEQHADDELFD